MGTVSAVLSQFLTILENKYAEQIVKIASEFIDHTESLDSSQ
jgi:hypothetical protein